MTTKDRGKKSTNLTKVKSPEGLPDYLVKMTEGDTSLDDLRKERTLSRIKVIHGSAGPDLKKLFSEGDVIISPGQTLVAPAIKEDQESEPWFMVPLLFFIEYCKWSDINDSANPTILARSFDKGCDLALKAKDPSKREEKYGEEFIAKYVEHLNFASVIVGDHPLSEQMEPFILGFSRGEWSTGKNFITTIARISAPLWSTIWKFNSSYRTKGNFNWWGIDYFIPNKKEDKIARFISKNQIELFKESHEELKRLFNERMIMVDRSDADDVPNEDLEPEEY